MALSGVLRPGFVQLRVLDLDEALVHYRDRIGLDVVGREADGRVYLRAYDEFDRHSLVLRQADAPGIDRMGWKVDRDARLDEFQRRLAAAGVDSTFVPADEQPGVGRRLTFVLPTGHRFDLYADIDRCASGPMTDNPDVWRTEPRGMRATRFDHCLLFGDDLEGSHRILTEVLGFSLSEQGLDDTGSPCVQFFTCSNKPHDVAFARYPGKGKLHHCAFFLQSWDDVGHAADIIARHEISVDIGPTRHGMTRGQTIYFFDPSGNRNEVYAGGYMYYPDNPVRTWSWDKFGKGIFYYQRQLNERFLDVVT
jgi:catechol 2,3-dioxygenase